MGTSSPMNLKFVSVGVVKVEVGVAFIVLDVIDFDLVVR